MKELLEKLGLSDKEAAVYVALLELAEATVQNIARMSGVNRATTYVILEKLMRYGLASQVKKGKKTYFVAEDPRELGNILAAQEMELDARRDLLNDSMNLFTAVFNAKKGKPTVRYYEGEDGLEALDRYGGERLKQEKGDIYAVAPLDLVEERFAKRRRVTLEERVKDNIKSRVIYTHKNGPISAAENVRALRDAIYLPKEKLPLCGTVSLLPWGVKIYQMEAKNPYGILIEDEAIARSMRAIFELAWSGAQDSTVSERKKR